MSSTQSIKLSDIKIYVVGRSKEYGTWISHNIVDSIEEADLVILIGGSDCNPAAYGERQHPTTEIDKNRDMVEAIAYITAITCKKPVLGICRGSQLATILNNGKLVQNIAEHAIYNGHRATHIESGYTFQVTSTHHQMMYPFKLNPEDYQILVKSTSRRSPYYMTGFGEYEPDDVPCEPEVVYYPKTNTLAVQYHPEYMPQDSDAVVFTKKLIQKYLFNDEIILQGAAKPQVEEGIFDGLLQEVPADNIRRRRQNPVWAEAEPIIPRPILPNEDIF